MHTLLYGQQMLLYGLKAIVELLASSALFSLCNHERCLGASTPSLCFRLCIWIHPLCLALVLTVKDSFSDHSIVLRWSRLVPRIKVMLQHHHHNHCTDWQLTSSSVGLAQAHPKYVEVTTCEVVEQPFLPGRCVQATVILMTDNLILLYCCCLI